VIIAKAEVFQYTLPLSKPIPLRGRTLETRSGLLLRIYSPDGLAAWGEAAPLPGFSRENLSACRKKLVDTAKALLAPGANLDDEGMRKLDAFRGPVAHSATYFSVESAWHMLDAAVRNVSPWHAKAPGRNASLQINALLTGEENQIYNRAREAAAQGYRAVKLKVGREQMAEDIRIVRAVRESIGPEVDLRLDANQAWSLEDSILFGRAIRASNPAYIEEPCANFGDLPAFHRATGIPYAIDESIYTIHDMLLGRAPTQIGERAIAGIVKEAAALVWKPTLVHTPTLGALLFRDVAQGQSSRVVLSAAYESGVGIAALANYAAMFAAPETCVGLDTYAWIEPDILKERLPMQSGTVDLYAINNAAQTVDMDRLEQVWP